MKQGEEKAKQLLEKIGLKFEDYSDEGKESMPDLKLVDGSFIEVTHTEHNQLETNNVFLATIDNYNEDQIKILKEKGIKVLYAFNFKTLKKWRREIEQYKINKIKPIPNENNSYIIFQYIEEIEKHFNKNINLKCQYYNEGYYDEVVDLYKFCHFLNGNLEMRIFNHDTIIFKIEEKNNKKYNINDSQISLFLWLHEYEYKILQEKINEKQWNQSYNSLINELKNTKFKKIYFGCYFLEEGIYSEKELYIFDSNKSSIELIKIKG